MWTPPPVCFEGEETKTQSRQLQRFIEFVCQQKTLRTFNRKKEICSEIREFAKKNKRDVGALCWHLQSRLFLSSFSLERSKTHRHFSTLTYKPSLKYGTERNVKILVAFYLQQNEVQKWKLSCCQNLPPTSLSYLQANSLLLQEKKNNKKARPQCVCF